MPEQEITSSEEIKTLKNNILEEKMVCPLYQASS